METYNKESAKQYKVKLNSSNHITLRKMDCDASQCKEHCVLAINKFGKIHECRTNGCIANRIETNTLHKAEEKMYTREGVFSTLEALLKNKQLMEAWFYGSANRKAGLKEWFEQNVK